MSSYVDAASNTSGAASTLSLSLTAPAAAIVGDLMLVCLVWRDAGNDITPPAGWTEIIEQSGSNPPNLVIWVGYRIFEAGDSIWTWTSSLSRRAAGGMIVCRDASVGNFDTAEDVDLGDDTVDAPSVTVILNNSIHVTFWTGTGQATWTPDASMTERLDATSTAGANDVSVSGATEAVDAGPTGAQTGTASVNLTGIGVSVVAEDVPAVRDVIRSPRYGLTRNARR